MNLSWTDVILKYTCFDKIASLTKISIRSDGLPRRYLASEYVEQSLFFCYIFQTIKI